MSEDQQRATGPGADERFDAVLGSRRGEGRPGGRRPLRPGDRFRRVMPWTEACVHFRVAGQVALVEVVGTGQRLGARLLNDEGVVVAGALSLSEVGIRRDEHGPYVED